MPTFRYTYTDPSSEEPVRTGHLDATDRSDALWQLASQGFDPGCLALEELLPEAAPPAERRESETGVEETAAASAASGRRLNDAEAQTVAAEVASLARAGLPLPGGLRALADELGPGRTAAVLREVAGWIEGGQSLEDALRMAGDRFPGHLRGMITAGAASGRLSEVLETYVDLRRDQAELRRRMWLAVAYPLTLIGLMLLLFFFFAMFVVPSFAKIFADFDARLPALTEVVLSLSGPVGLYIVIAVLAAIGLFLWAIAGPAPYWVRLCVYRIPIFGPFLRWSRLMPLARLLTLLVEHGTPLPQALRWTADGLAERRLAARCLEAANAVEAGHPLGESLTATGLFPYGTMPLLDWGARFGSLPAALQFISESFESRTRLQIEMAQIVVLPAVLIVVLQSSILIISLFLPLISLIHHLSK